MPDIAILTDSTADLSPDLIAANHLTVIPLIVQFGGQTYRDGVDMTTDRLFALAEAHRKLPTTSSPNVADFQAAFAEAARGDRQVLYIGISSKLSSTFQNAAIAAGLFPAGQVRVFDSLNLSTGIGLQVLVACDLARQGKSVEEIIATLEQVRPKVRTAFMIDTLDYLHMGGRCSSVQALVGSLLKLRPIIAVEGGAMGVAAKTRGSRQKGLDWMLERLAEDARAGGVQPDRVFITHTGVPEDARYVADEVRRILPEVAAVIETRAGSVIGSHCGPGTIGIIYVVK